MRLSASARIATMTIALATTSLATSAAAQAVAPDTQPASAAASADQLAANPLLGTWTTPDAVPPYDRIKPEHYEPAFDEAMRQTRIELDAIATDPAPPTFANVIEALDRSGALLTRVSYTFGTVSSADATPELQAVDVAVTPKLSRFESQTYLDQRLFGRVDTLWKQRASLKLTPEQARLLEVTHKQFIRSGAALPEAQRQRLAQIDERLSSLSVEFGQKLLAAQKAGDLFLTEAELAGMPADFKAGAAAKANAAGKPGLYLVSSTRSEVEPFLTLATNRPARQKVFTTFEMRNDGGEHDTRGIIREMTSLRLERAKLLGFATHADYVLDNSMARTPDAASGLLRQVYEAGLKRARQEEADLLRLAKSDRLTKLEPWDWRFYAEKLRKQRYALDETKLKQYLPLDGMVAALFETTNRLFDLQFKPRPDVPVWRPDVKVWEVTDSKGQQVGLFYADWFARDTKRPGAWMNAIRQQNGLTGEKPIVTNNSNFIPPAAGERALLSFDDSETLFHEFGHALHGLLSKTRYPGLAGTSVYRDFVEVPSQIYEHWVSEPDVLTKHAVNASGEAMPRALLDSLLNARTFNQGYLTVQQLSSALVDMELHRMPALPADFDPVAFEKATLKTLGVPEAIGMRHRLSHFSHLFNGGYSAGYYAYTWSEVLEADGFEAFMEAGSAWDKPTADRYRHEILERGNSRDPAESWIAFRGRMSTPDALLRNRGLK